MSEQAEYRWHDAAPSPTHGFLLPAITAGLPCAPARVLDLGAGNGSMARRLIQQGYTVTAVEMSPSGAAQARRVPGLDVIEADLSRPLPDALHGSFDAVVSAEVIEHLLLPRSLFHRAREALRPAGTLVVTTPFHGYLKNLAISLTNGWDDHWHPTRDYGHVKFFSVATLSALFDEAAFTVRSVERVGRIRLLPKCMVFTAVAPLDGRAAS